MLLKNQAVFCELHRGCVCVEETGFLIYLFSRDAETECLS